MARKHEENLRQQSRRARPFLPASAAIVGALAALTGCVSRVLEVRSEPPGATVYINGREAGTTPMEHSFDFYGTVEVTLRHQGYRAYRGHKKLDVPWYQVFPLDLASEFLWPFPVRDVHTFEARLEPYPVRTPRAGSEAATEAEAQALRERARSERQALAGPQ